MSQPLSVSEKRGGLNAEINAVPSCLLCLEDLGAADITSFPCRTHRFHHKCVITYARHCLKARKCPIPCPVFSHDGSYLTSIQAYGHLLHDRDAELYDSIVQDNRVASDPTLTYCHQPGCREVIRLPQHIVNKVQADNEEEIHTGVVCAGCNKEFVLRKRSKEEEEFDAFALSEGMRRCPGCATYIKAEGGCRRMTCFCGAKWCFHCGKPRAAKCRCEAPQHQYPEHALTPRNGTEEDVFARVIRQGALRASGVVNGDGVPEGAVDARRTRKRVKR